MDEEENIYKKLLNDEDEPDDEGFSEVNDEQIEDYKQVFDLDENCSSFD
jgi:hypothetical protein